MNKNIKSFIITVLIVVVFVFFVIPLSFLYSNIYLTNIPNTETPANYGLKYKDVFVITSDGKRLSGWYIPNNLNKGTVILCHGVKKNKANILNVTRYVHSAGYEIYQFDFRGHGDSDKSKISYGYEETKDIKAIVNYLKSLGKNKLGIYGLSMGGAIILLSAPQNPELKVIVVDSTFASCEGMISYRIGKFFPEELKNILVKLTMFYASAFYGINIDKIAPINIVSKINRPILFITGDKDTTIVPSNTYRLYNAANQPKELLVIKGLKHAQTINSPFFKAKLIEFLNNYLPKAKSK